MPPKSTRPFFTSKITFSFFFQAEDSIRAGRVTGVQTCALPIPPGAGVGQLRGRAGSAAGTGGRGRARRERSEERRVGKGCRCRGARGHIKKKARRHRIRTLSTCLGRVRGTVLKTDRGGLERGVT